MDTNRHKKKRGGQKGRAKAKSKGKAKKNGGAHCRSAKDKHQTSSHNHQQHNNKDTVIVPNSVLEESIEQSHHEEREELKTNSPDLSSLHGMHGCHKTDHLRQRQTQRNISDAELKLAIQEGEKVVSREDASIRYSFKGVVYVTTSEGVGLTAYRLEPLQCICNVHSRSDIRNTTPTLRFDGRQRGRVQSILERFAMQILLKNLRDCGNLQQFQTCMGCKVHRTPTDPLAIFLEQQKWASPSMCGVLSHPDMLPYLILAAAGSLLRPVRCGRCHGVQTLARSPNIADESDTLPWLRQLLELREKQNKGRMQKDKAWADLFAGDFLPIDVGVMSVARGINSLAAAAVAGHFRCSLELLRHGASVDKAMLWDGGHTVCYLWARALSPEIQNFRRTSACCRYEEILAMLAYASGKDGFQTLSLDDEDHCIELLNIIGMWDNMSASYQKMGMRVVGTTYDGHCHRFVCKGRCDCCEEQCVLGATVVSTIGIKFPKLQSNSFVCYDEPAADKKVLDFVKQSQSKETRKKCCGHGAYCCHDAHQAAKLLQADMKMNKNQKKMKRNRTFVYVGR